MDIRREANELGQAILNAISLYGEGGDVSDILLTHLHFLIMLIARKVALNLF